MHGTIEPPAQQENVLLSEVERVLRRVSVYREKAKEFYLRVLLNGHRCPRCGETLSADGPGRCVCPSGHSLDPTLAFQHSPCCHALLRKRICHYACGRCGRSVPSRFLFDERIFDAAYFRDRMRQSREERSARRRQLRCQAIDARSQSLAIEELPDIDDVPGLAQDLAEFIGQAQATDDEFPGCSPQDVFDLARYQATIRDALSPEGSLFSELPTLGDNHRLDMVRRFMSLVFMEHVGDVALSPFGQTDVLVVPREAHS